MKLSPQKGGAFFGTQCRVSLRAVTGSPCWQQLQHVTAMRMATAYRPTSYICCGPWYGYVYMGVADTSKCLNMTRK